jgi:hypothetical protein
MAYVLVLLLAAAAGAAVGIATLRTGGVRLAHPETWSATYAQDRPAPDAAVVTGPESGSAAGHRPLPTDPTWQTRVTGVLGLLVACLVGAGLVVAALYATFLAVKRAFGG